MDRDATIFALASGKAPAAIAVIRVSGGKAAQAWSAVSGRPMPAPRHAVRAPLRDACGEHLDDALALWFPAPESYTGEDVLELHVHGGRAVVAGVVEALGRVPELRPAEPGEFTRRAFEKGKFDLTAAEAVADLIEAETGAQRRQALRQMDGALGQIYEDWRRRLVTVLAHMEAEIDFPDEDVAEGEGIRLAPEVAALAEEIAEHLDDDHRGERLRDGLYVAIVGAPNVGKSSLLNRLARRDAAIVSATAGTTRDVIEVHMDLAGLPIVLADTAGLREAGDEIEIEGVRRARDRAKTADLKLAVFDASVLPAVDGETAALVDETCVVVFNKCDLASASDGGLPTVNGRPGIGVSAKNGTNLGTLLDAIEGEVQERWGETPTPALTQVRHRRALEDCVAALARSREVELSELAAEDIRLAARALGRITGSVDVEEILDVVFRDFCIGK